MAEETGNVYIVYVYDDASTPIGMLYGITNGSETAWTAYCYEKNLQGDIVAYMLSRKSFIIILFAWIIIGVVCFVLNYTLPEPINAPFSTLGVCSIAIIICTLEIQYADKPVKYGHNLFKSRYLRMGKPHIYRGMCRLGRGIFGLGFVLNFVEILRTLLYF